MSFLNICMWRLWSWTQEGSLLSSPAKSVEGCMLDGSFVSNFVWICLSLWNFTGIWLVWCFLHCSPRFIYVFWNKDDSIKDSFCSNVYIILQLFFFLIEGGCRRGRGDQWRYRLITSFVNFHPCTDLILINSSCLWQINLLLSEFDKFLEERAKAADSLPSPPGAHPAHPARAPGGSHKKAERTEDALFAL